VFNIRQTSLVYRREAKMLQIGTEVPFQRRELLEETAVGTEIEHCFN